MNVKGIGSGFEAIGKTISAADGKNAGQKLLRKISSINEPVKSAVNPTMFAVALYSCVLGPRTKAAAERSSTEKREVITRDAFAITTLVFALKAINGAIAKAAEKKTGLVLTSETKSLKGLNPFQKFFEFVRPSKGVQVLSNEQLVSKLALSDSAGTKELKGLINWLDQSGGNAAKALTADTKKGGALSSLANQLFEGGIAGKKAGEIVDALDKKPEIAEKIINVLKHEDNPLIQKGKFVNSAIIKTVGLAVVVAILGIGIQMFNQFLTNRLDKKRREGKITEQEWQEGKDLINRLKLTSEQSKTFQDFVKTSKTPLDVK